MLSNTGIREQVQAEICKFAEKYQLEQVILFGSRARGDFSRTSDIDLAVRGGNIVRFAVDVDEETSTLLKYDVVDLSHTVSPQLLRAIEAEGRVLYEKI
ncbi:MAG: nucleotidyltransferase domain-containing protein [Oscillospiraceae bacterium]|nr:nucleotidyltransferase domain-containing protein [Oscillospiraceae bacterium]